MQFKSEIASLPSYPPPAPAEAARRNVVKLSANENPLGPSPYAVAAMQAELLNVHRYPDASSIRLREALAVHFDLQPDMVACCNGADEMILLLCLTMLRPGDEVVMANGTFISYLLRTVEVGGTPIRVPLRDYTHDLEAMADAITDRTRLFFLCNPNNPTGTGNSASEVMQLLARMPEHVLVVVDEAYSEYVERADYPDVLPLLRQKQRNILVLRTFAKIYGLAGLRIGYSFGHPDVIDYLDRSRQKYNVSSLAQAAGIAALQDREHLERSRRHAAVERQRLAQGLLQLGLQPIPSETNFVAAQVGDDQAVVHGMHQRGFDLLSLSAWGLPGCIRISLGLADENQRFLQTLAEVLAGMDARLA